MRINNTKIDKKQGQANIEVQDNIEKRQTNSQSISVSRQIYTMSISTFTQRKKSSYVGVAVVYGESLYTMYTVTFTCYVEESRYLLLPVGLFLGRILKSNPLKNICGLARVANNFCKLTDMSGDRTFLLQRLQLPSLVFNCKETGMQYVF